MKEFKNKVMFITGAGHGFGKVIAEEGARRGMKLALVDIDEPALTATAKAIEATGAQVLAIPADVTKEELVTKPSTKPWPSMAPSTYWSTTPASPWPVACGSCRRAIGNGFSTPTS